MRTDGKVDISCPQCGAAYRVAEEMLDQKIECTECHRVFFAKTTAGKRAKPPDHTKVYVGFGIAIVVIIALFVVIGSGGGKEPAKKPVATAPKAPQFTLGTHPRTAQLVKWAQAIGTDNQLVATTHSDLGALATALGVDGRDEAAVLAALQAHDSTRYLRELTCDSASLSSEADMTAATGSGVVYVTPKPGDDNYKRNTRGEIAVRFRMDGEQVKVTGFEVKMKPVWNPAKPDPNRKGVIIPDKNIARPDAVEISDSAGTRTVQESKPGPMPHWEKATPEQQKMADEVVADIIRSADNSAPGPLFNQATMKIQTMADKQATVPRVLNAMYELYADVNANNMKLSQLNRALVAWTGYAVNYQVEAGADPAKDKAQRESCVRQWFAFWWRYHGDLSEFFDARENLDEPLEDPKAPKKK